MSNKDKANDTKGGTGRVGLYMVSRLPHCYTLEVNYRLALWRNLPLPNKPLSEKHLPDYVFKRKKVRDEMNLDTFEDVGKALVISILDLEELNPLSRIKTSPF